MKITKTLYIKNKEDWRKWLEKSHDKEKEIWLVYYKKSSGKLRIPYNEAVDEALCFGWIDSIVKSIDEESYVQRFTPRRKNSPISEMNKERVRRLIKQKRMTSYGLKAISKFFNLEKDKKEKFTIPEKILKALKSDKEVWKNFQNFPKGYQKVRISYIESQEKHSKENFEKSLRNFIKMTKKNKKFGMLK